MNRYETVFSFNPGETEENINKNCQKLKELIENGSGEIVSFDHWGLKKILQPVNKQNELYYCYINFKAPGKLIADIENFYRITHDFISHIVIRLNEKELDLKNKEGGDEYGRSEDAGTEQSNAGGETDQGS